MTAITRIARRLVRKLTKPLRLAVIRYQLALSAGNVVALEDARIETLSLLRAEHVRQVQLMARQRAVEGDFA
jgi:hypothetical protein